MCSQWAVNKHSESTQKALFKHSKSNQWALRASKSESIQSEPWKDILETLLTLHYGKISKRQTGISDTFTGLWIRSYPKSPGFWIWFWGFWTRAWLWRVHAGSFIRTFQKTFLLKVWDREHPNDDPVCIVPISWKHFVGLGLLTITLLRCLWSV